ncbi:MAG TPA: formate hydrogenlyase subunit 3 [Arsenophonus nasoniae]|uniref:formate hydrogenlyase subunit 3 n=1 Tax=Arsenophonus nasoniae TaxID=638 RepID=UPI00387A62A4
MSVEMLINAAIFTFVISGLLAALLMFNKSLSGLIAGLGGVLANLAMLLACGQVLLGIANASDFMLAVGNWSLHITALNGLWLVVFGLPGIFVSLFNISWHRHHATQPNGWLINLLLAAATLAVVAGHLAMLVMMAEIMMLCALFLTGCQQASKVWFVLGRLGTLLLVMMCVMIWRTYGTLNIAELRLLMVTLPMSSVTWILGLIGFGLLAGIIPLHGWVVPAHANATAPAAALFSTVVLKVGVYGILLLSLLNATLPLWWAIVVLLLGMVTAFVGGLYALMEHNINRLLAYHSLENIGIILLGLGAGLVGVSLHDPLLIALGMVGGLYHLFSHSLFKTTLLLGAGAVWFRTGYLDIEKLGGIGKRMPLLALAMLVGLMSMAALPPLNGFAGEWIIYQSFFRLGEQPAFISRLLGPLLATGLAITGALAVMCMAKVYGVMFCGAPRTQAAEKAYPAPWLMNISLVALAFCCVVGGVAAPWIMPLLSYAVPLPLVTNQTMVSQPMITLLLIAATLLPVVLLIICKDGRLPFHSRGSAWVCGYQYEQAMSITASGFAQPVKVMFALVFKLGRILNPASLLPGWQTASLPVLFRRVAFIELAVLLVVVIS